MMNCCGERLVASRLRFVFVFLILERSVAVIVVPMLEALHKHGLPSALEVYTAMVKDWSVVLASLLRSASVSQVLG